MTVGTRLRAVLVRLPVAQRVALGVGSVLLTGLVAWLVVASLGSEPARELAVATPTATPSPTVSPTPRPTRRPTPRPTPSPTATPSPTPALTLDDLNVTVLLVGRDFLAERIPLGEQGMNTDMLILANVHADGSRIDLVSLPRDSVDVPLGDGSVWGAKINSLRAALGLPALKQAMAATFGVPIDYYAEMTLDDLSGLVNAVGGVTVTLGAPLYDPHLGMSWRAGENVLDGRNAVLFARSRYGDSDYARAERNQVLLMALRNRLLAGGYDPVAMLTGLAGLATDIPAADFPMLLELAQASAAAPVSYAVLAPPAYTQFVGLAGARGWISVPNIPAIHAHVASFLAPP